MPAIQSQNDPIINLPNLYKYGLKISVPGSGDVILNISPGMCRDSNNNIDIELGSQNVESVGAVDSLITINGANNGANGIDEGSLTPNTMYSVYVVADSRYYLPVAGLLSLSSTVVPVLPQGYDSYRKIGYWGIDSSGHFYLGDYQGIGNDIIFWYAGIYNGILALGSETSSTPINLSAVVPSVDNTLITVTTEYTPISAGDYYRLSAPVSVNEDFHQYGQVNGGKITDQVNVNSQLASGIPTIEYLVSDPDDTLQIWINGFYCSV